MQISIKHKTSVNEVHKISSCTHPRFENGYLSPTRIKIPVDGDDIKIPGGDIKIPVDGMAMFEVFLEYLKAVGNVVPSRKAKSVHTSPGKDHVAALRNARYYNCRQMGTKKKPDIGDTHIFVGDSTRGGDKGVADIVAIRKYFGRKRIKKANFAIIDQNTLDIETIREALGFVADAGALFIQCDGIYDKHSIGVVQFMTTLFTEIKITYHSQCIVIAAIGYCHVGDSVPPVDVVDEDVPDPEWLPQLRINNSKRWLAVADDKIWLSNIIGM